MAQGLLDLFRSQEYGNANVALIRNKGIKPGTMLLELFFRLETVAPKGLGVDTALPSQTLRVLLDQDGRDLSARVAHEVLAKQLQPLERGVARQVVKSQQALLETLLGKAVRLAETQVPAVQSAALQHWQQQNHAEIARLKALAAVNPAVRPAEIRALEQRLHSGERALGDLRAVAHAVRLIVAG